MSDERAISSVLGVVLILGITVAAVTSLMVIGTIALQQTQDDAELSRMETSMAQMSSKASLTALGDAKMQRFELGDTTDGQFHVDPSAGQVVVEYESDGEINQLFNSTLGSLKYENGEHEIAFQGGGVWMKAGDDGGSMVSPPEYHYQHETLTFPIIRIGGIDGTFSAGSGTIEHDRFEPIFPHQEIEDLANPVEDTTIWVEIESEYHRGWYNFFQSRSAGEIQHDVDNQTVRAELTAPFEEEIQYAVGLQSTLSDEGDWINGSWNENLHFPSVTDQVEEKIATCEDGNGSTDVSTIDGSEERYCVAGDQDISGAIDTFDEDIEVVINGTVTYQNLNINGNGTVRVFTRDASIEGDVNEGGQATSLITYVHSDADMIPIGNHDHYTGVIYAPNSIVDFLPHSSVSGSVIADELEYPGSGGPGQNTPVIEFSDELKGIDIGVATDSDVIRYLHISENVITFEFS